MTSKATLEKTISDSTSATSRSMDHERNLSRDVDRFHSSKSWTNKSCHSVDDDDPHVFDSNDSRGPSAQSHGDHQALVSDPSKESPFLESSSNSPDFSTSKSKEWQRRHRWPLFPSPKSSSPNSKVIMENRSDRDTPRDKVHLQPSPANGWPQRSPIKPDHDHEVASFALFTHSFDTLSETGQQFFRPSPVKTSKDHADGHRTPEENGHPPRKIQVHGPTVGEMVDISPIKLDGQRLHRSSSRPESKESRGNTYGDYGAAAGQSGTHNAPSVAFVPAPHYGNDEYRGHGPSTYDANGYSATASNPFYVLRSVRKAFDQCTYKLPCLYDGEICAVNVRNHATIHRFQDDHGMGFRELEIARRRVDSAVHAFGGYTNPTPQSQQSTIFRDRKSSAKEYYDNLFHRRYFAAGNHISWEVENNPPVASAELEGCNEGIAVSGFRENHCDGRDGYSNNDGSEVPNPEYSGPVVPIDNHQKMRYRCKLCGQLKQNHSCPYQQSLQRSIAITVYPAVNAFTADEPGVLTKPLSEMNNFVSYDGTSDPRFKGLSPDHPGLMAGRVTHVTPDTAGARLLHNSPESSLSTRSEHYDQYSSNFSPRQGRKRHHEQVNATTPALSDRSNVRPAPYFVPRTLALRPEHYRAVTPRKNARKAKSDSLVGGASEDYQYPHVPLTFPERKRLSDTVFFLSKEVPTMMTHVAPLLRMARGKDEWDLAASQILAQLVVALYCGEGDYKLDGLKQYLLGIGIAC